MAGESLAVGRKRAIFVSPEETAERPELMPINAQSEAQKYDAMDAEGGTWKMKRRKPYNEKWKS